MELVGELRRNSYFSFLGHLSYRLRKKRIYSIFFKCPKNWA